MASNIELGKDALYPDQYDPALLAPISRSQSRSALFSSDTLPFQGEDVWTAYELSWLDSEGKPFSAIAEFRFPHDSESIIESKSFKYYLNSFNQTRFSSGDIVAKKLAEDLSLAAGGEVSVFIELLSSQHQYPIAELEGECVDELPITGVDCYSPDADLLQTEKSQVTDQALYSHLLKSNCPVTGQPDWATVWIKYSGAKINSESFLRYVISYRQHQDFHENCVEKMFKDIMEVCRPNSLAVYARYTRRGGLDINPYRTNTDEAPPMCRIARQ